MDGVLIIKVTTTRPDVGVGDFQKNSPQRPGGAINHLDFGSANKMRNVRSKRFNSETLENSFKFSAFQYESPGLFWLKKMSRAFFFIPLMNSGRMWFFGNIARYNLETWRLQHYTR